MPRFHHQDRTAAGIAASFRDAGRVLPEGMAEVLADRIARHGGWQEAYAALRASKVVFAGWTAEDRLLAELVVAEADADSPETPLMSLRQFAAYGGKDEGMLARLRRLEAIVAGRGQKAAA